MSVHANDASTWKETWPSINNSGTYEDAESTTDGVIEVYANVSGTWRMCWPLKSSVAAQTISRLSAAGAVTAGVTLQTDGRLKKYATGISAVYVDFADNAPDTDKGGAAPTLFQYKWETNPDTPDTTPVAVSTWTDLTADATWESTDSSPTGGDGPNHDITIHIRAKSATASEISFNVKIAPEYDTT
jgi:hypothetical protein